MYSGNVDVIACTCSNGTRLTGVWSTDFFVTVLLLTVLSPPIYPSIYLSPNLPPCWSLLDKLHMTYWYSMVPFRSELTS